MSEQAIDPVCAFHGKRWSEHEHGRCLFCCLCFKTLTIEECAYLPDGSRQDICVPCVQEEQKLTLWHLEQSRARLAALENVAEKAWMAACLYHAFVNEREAYLIPSYDQIDDASKALLEALSALSPDRTEDG